MGFQSAMPNFWNWNLHEYTVNRFNFDLFRRATWIESLDQILKGHGHLCDCAELDWTLVFLTLKKVYLNLQSKFI